MSVNHCKLASQEELAFITRREAGLRTKCAEEFWPYILQASNNVPPMTLWRNGSAFDSSCSCYRKVPCSSHVGVMIFELTWREASDWVRSCNAPGNTSTAHPLPEKG
ncbi:hypothetical protein O181_002149 [Austropuccinia psidii MF-1]|uniref:Uncharacterized protein n=1 Tax=Austropuccinia psidii MF-1 TaxID=1389203 RepID=A0A9Q3BBS5_9BASI|nr:hypothetical protein [Austropuccinia psidii MF-1]